MQIENSFNCLKHTDYKLEHLKINDIDLKSEEPVMQCGACLDENNNHLKNYILIKKIIDHGSQKIVSKWPPIKDNKIIEELSNMENSVSILDQISDFFDTFSKEVLDKI